MSEIKRLSDADYKYVYSRTPRLCIDLAIPTESGLILTQRAIEPFKGLWHFPGGRVQYKESIEEAIKRISKAELGVEAVPQYLLGSFEVVNDGEFAHSVSLVFLSSLTSEKIQGDFQSTKIQAFPKLPEDTHPYHKDFLEKHWDKIFPRV